MKRSVVLSGLAAFVMAFLGTLIASTFGSGSPVLVGRAAVNQTAASPAGTWVITVTNASTGAQSTVLAAISSDGSFQRVGVNHLMETPGFGSWAKVSDYDYDIIYMTLQFDRDGALAGSRKS